MKKAIICTLLAIMMILGVLTGCASTNQVPPEDLGDPVTLVIAGAWEDCKAIEAVGREFSVKYPNCTIEYEYLQDFDTALMKRVTGDNIVDLFFTNNIQSDSELLPYVQDFFSCEELDLSSTFDGLIENFVFFGEKTSEKDKLYSIPLGAELRGLYVNKTLLDNLNIEIPSDQASLLEACAVLKENGYIPFHGNPGMFAQTLLYPWVCNIIANADDPQAVYDMVNNRSENLGEMFSEPFNFMYLLVENYYYDYKAAQTENNLFVDTTDVAYARDFFNIRQNGEAWEKVDDLGQVAFMPSPMSMQGVMDKVKEDYHSSIEYIFIPAPVGKDGGYSYMSPARGIAATKNSENLEWSIKFLDFLFTPENNKLFAEEFDIIPNTAEAFDYISELYDMPEDHISQLGQVTFDYAFYNIITDALLNISKGNNPKYMQQNADGSTSLYPLEYYVDAFEEAIRGDAQ